MKKQTQHALFALAVAGILTATQALAAIVVDDSFNNSVIDNPPWNSTAGSPVSLDDPNDQVIYSHTAGTTRRWGNYASPSPSILTNKQGYLKATISGYTGPATGSIRFGFWGATIGNNANYAYTKIAGDGVYEVFFNNTAGSLSFDNDAGWTGSLASHEGVWSTNGGTTSAAITIGTGIAADTTVFGFGFANFGNSSVFPSSSFNIEDVLVHDTLLISGPPPSGLATKLVITSSSVTTTAGVSSSAITVERQDGSSTPVTVDPDLTVNLSTTAGGTGVFRDAGDSGDITSVIIPTNSSSITFLYRDTLAGTPTITVTASGLTSDNQQETVNPDAIASYAVSAAAAQAVDVPFNTTVSAKDQFNNTVTTDSSTVVTMTSSGATVFDSNGDSTFNDNTKTLVNGEFTISAKDGTAETMTLTATDGNSKTGTSGSIGVSLQNPAILVDWDGTAGDVVTAHQNIAQETTFTTGSFQSPAQGGSYYPDGITNFHSPNFYAALSDTAGLSSWAVFNGAVSDLLGRWQVTSGTSGTRSSMLAWDVNSTNALDSFTLNGFSTFGANVTNQVLRFLFQASNDNWYASDEIIGVAISDAPTLDWYDYTPHTGGVATFGSLAGGIDFTHAKRVGYYQEFSTTGGGGVYAVQFVVTDDSQHVPVANSYATNVVPGGVVNIPLAELGSDADGDPLTFSIVSSPTNGVAVLDGSSLTYTNTSGAPGSGDAIQFAVTDGISGTATNTVTISIDSTSPSPTNITYSVIGNDLVLDWPAGQGWKLERLTNSLANGLLGTNWVQVATDPSYTNTLNVAPTVFYRLVY